MSTDYTPPNVIGYGTRVTRAAAQAAYDIGGEILVVTDTDRGERIDVTDHMTVNDPSRTPWYELAASVDTWSSRYPGQTFYVVVYTVHQDEPDCDGLGCDLGGCEKCQPSNDVYTRRLIVTLPNVSGEQADQVASELESELRADFLDSPSDYAEATVTHALGETLPKGITIKDRDGQIAVTQAGRFGVAMIGLENPLEARQLAGVLIARAEAIEAITGQTPGLPE